MILKEFENLSVFISDGHTLNVTRYTDDTVQIKDTEGKLKKKHQIAMKN